jgi:hypothetical protein
VQRYDCSSKDILLVWVVGHFRLRRACYPSEVLNVKTRSTTVPMATTVRYKLATIWQETTVREVESGDGSEIVDLY